MNDEARPWGAAALLQLMLAVFLVFALLLPLPALAAAPERLVPVGRAVGIKLFSDGVVVVGTSEVATGRGKVNPAKECGLREGDVITHINSTEVDSIEEVTALLQELEGQPMSIRAVRRDRQVQLTARAVFCPAEGTYKLGAWIRDSMAGIGTVTYCDPATGAFGALGHGINDVDTAALMSLSAGSIMETSVKAVKRSDPGDPGELRGDFAQQRDVGTLTANTAGGIFGTLADKDLLPQNARALPIAAPQEVKTGPASILTTVAGSAPQEYAVEITKVYHNGGLRNLLLRVTDPALLERTGGIVQGMSGSPILQEGRLVGAVTHVLIDDPAQGYGIFIDNMLRMGA